MPGTLSLLVRGVVDGQGVPEFLTSDSGRRRTDKLLPQHGFRASASQLSWRPQIDGCRGVVVDVKGWCRVAASCRNEKFWGANHLGTDAPGRRCPRRARISWSGFSPGSRSPHGALTMRFRGRSCQSGVRKGTVGAIAVGTVSDPKRARRRGPKAVGGQVSMSRWTPSHVGMSATQDGTFARRGALRHRHVRSDGMTNTKWAQSVPELALHDWIPSRRIVQDQPGRAQMRP